MKLLWLLLFICSLLTLGIGDIPWSSVWAGMLQRLFHHSTAWNPLLDERLPRLIVILCTGASLAVAGAVMQALFQNPLASPSILGISAGGSLCAIPIFIAEWHVTYPFSLPIAAFGGCLGTLFLVYFLARKEGQVSMAKLILTGIAISTLFLAIQGAILYALRDNWQLIQMISEWEAGSTTDRSWKQVHMQLPLTIVGLIGCWQYRQELNLLALGDEEALNLGVDVPKVRLHLFIHVALLTGGALAAVGVIAFFGLVLPHVLRQIKGPDYLRLIPLCILGGAGFLALMDLLLRIFDIHSLSIGNVSAILGGIFFLSLLLGRRQYAAT